MEQALFFIAILPPDDVAAQVRGVQQEIADHFGPHRAMRIPVHITVEPPFRRADTDGDLMHNLLKDFFIQQSAFLLELKNFGAFRHDVIFIDVAPNLALLELQQQLRAFMRETAGLIKEPPLHDGYKPHLTVANRDVTPQQHRAIWHEFQNRKFFARFPVREICLLQHDGKIWHVRYRFALSVT